MPTMEGERLSNKTLDIESNPEILLEKQEDIEHLINALEKLPYPYRLIIVLYYFEECSYREIAKILNIPIGTVKIQLYRAKEMLRENIYKK